MSRRKFLGVVGTAGVIGGLKAIHDGVDFEFPLWDSYVFTVGQPVTSEPFQAGQVLYKRIKSDSDYILTQWQDQAQIIVRSSYKEFTPGETIPTLHRSGDYLRLLNVAVEQGIPGIDMDVSNANGHLFADHGSIFRLKFGFFSSILRPVIDTDDKRIDFSGPTSFRTRIEQIATKNDMITDPSKKLVVMAEAKNGKFHSNDLKKMIQIIQKNDLAAIFFGGAINKLAENIYRS